MKKKLGLDQTAAWLLAFLVACGIFTGVYYLFKKLAHKQEDFYSDTDSHDNSQSAKEHGEEEGISEEHGAHAPGQHDEEESDPAQRSTSHFDQPSEGLPSGNQSSDHEEEEGDDEDLESEAEIPRPSGVPQAGKQNDPAPKLKENLQNDHSSLDSDLEDEEENEDGESGIKKVSYEEPSDET